MSIYTIQFTVPLEQWAALQASLDREDGRAAALAELAVLLKRTALSSWPRDEVAALSGPAWIAFLRHQGGRASIDEPMERLLHDTEWDCKLDCVNAHL